LDEDDEREKRGGGEGSEEEGRVDGRSSAEYAYSFGRKAKRSASGTTSSWSAHVSASSRRHTSPLGNTRPTSSMTGGHFFAALRR